MFPRRVTPGLAYLYLLPNFPGISFGAFLNRLNPANPEIRVFTIPMGIDSSPTSKERSGSFTIPPSLSGSRTPRDPVVDTRSFAVLRVAKPTVDLRRSAEAPRAGRSGAPLAPQVEGPRRFYTERRCRALEPERRPRRPPQAPDLVPRQKTNPASRPGLQLAVEVQRIRPVRYGEAAKQPGRCELYNAPPFAIFQSSDRYPFDNLDLSGFKRLSTRLDEPGLNSCCREAPVHLSVLMPPQSSLPIWGGSLCLHDEETRR